MKRAEAILTSIIGVENIKLLSKDSVKISTSDSHILSKILLKLLTSEIDILDINKPMVDIESIYEKVYGDINDI